MEHDANDDGESVDDFVEDTMGEVSPVFMAQIPHPDKSTPTASYRYESYLIEYYENPMTIGGALGLKTQFKFPQLAVVRKNGIPVCVVRIEESLVGTSMLGVVVPTGVHRNCGMFSKSDRNSFLKQVAQVLKDIEGGR